MCCNNVASSRRSCCVGYLHMSRCGVIPEQLNGDSSEVGEVGPRVLAEDCGTPR